MKIYVRIQCDEVFGENVWWAMAGRGTEVPVGAGGAGGGPGTDGQQGAPGAGCAAPGPQGSGCSCCWGPPDGHLGEGSGGGGALWPAWWWRRRSRRR